MRCCIGSHRIWGNFIKVTHCSQAATWGQPGGSKIVHMEKSLFFKGGASSTDKVLERIENKYWKIEICDFNMWSFGFEKFQGEWFTKQLEEGKIEIVYKYTMFSNSLLLYPFSMAIHQNHLAKLYAACVGEH